MLLQARESVTQEVVVFDLPRSRGDYQLKLKKDALCKHLEKTLSEDEAAKVLVFVSQQKHADYLADKLIEMGYS